MEGVTPGKEALKARKPKKAYAYALSGLNEPGLSNS
jgi:hypothetical protein